MPRLTEQEQQEVIRFIESGRPLQVVDIFGNDTMTIVEVTI